MEKTYYEAYAELDRRNWWFTSRARIIEAVVRRWSPAKETGLVCDVGCGPTTTLSSLLSPSYNVVGLDVSPIAVEVARRHGRNAIECLSLSEYVSSGQKADLILLLDVLEHVQDEASFLAEICGALKPEGILIMTVPAYAWLWSPHDEVNHHFRRYTRNQALRTLKANGFESVHSCYFNTFLFPLAAMKKLMDKLRGPSGATDYNDRPPQWLNEILNAIFSSERWFVPWMGFPFGVSILAIAKKQK